MNPAQENDIDMDNVAEGFHIERMDRGGQDDDSEMIENESEKASDDDDEISEPDDIFENDDDHHDGSDDDDDEMSESDSDDDDDDEFAISFQDDNDDDWTSLKKYAGFQHIPEYMKAMAIDGCKTHENPLFQNLVKFFQTDNKIWDKIYLNGHESDDPIVFSVLLLYCTRKAKNLILYGMYDETFCQGLKEGLTKEDATVRELDVNIRIPVTNQMMREISTSLSDVRCILEKIAIGGDFTAPGNAAILANGLRQNQTLQQLEFIWTKFESGGLEHLFRSLKSHPRLKALDYRSGMTISLVEAEALGALVSGSSSKIEHLEVWQDTLESKVANSILKSLSELLTEQNLVLKELKFCRWGFDDSSILSLKRILQKLPSLKVLQLPENCLSNLSDLSTHWNTIGLIETLDLSHNYIGHGDKDADGLESLISQMDCLRVLTLRLHIDAESIIDGLQSNRYLEDLDMFGVTHKPEIALRVFPKIAHLLCVNEAGRRFVNEKLQSSVQANLWPLVFERAFRIPYDKRCLHRYREIYLDSRKKFRATMGANAVYTILRDSTFLFET